LSNIDTVLLAYLTTGFLVSLSFRLAIKKPTPLFVYLLLTVAYPILFAAFILLEVFLVLRNLLSKEI